MVQSFDPLEFAFLVQMVRSECKSAYSSNLKVDQNWHHVMISERNRVDQNFSGPKIRPSRIRFRKDPWTGSLGFTMATKQ